MKFNSFIEKIESTNSFTKVNQKVKEYKKNNPNAKIISLGVGDVTLPVAKPIIDAMKNAVDDLAKSETFVGYDQNYGYSFLKKAILNNEYFDMPFSEDEIYISGGTKTDVTSILELFDVNAKICVMSPTYPVYKNGAYALSRNVDVLPSSEENDFISDIPKEKYDIIYLCNPNNPVGNVFDKKDLEKWINYALTNNSVILYDNVYADFIVSKNAVKSIYEIKNAKRVAIEFRSFSKIASFTGVRCSYYIIPNDIDKNINVLWKKRTLNRFNGADYIAQKGALAIYENDTKKILIDNIKYYLDNALHLKKTFEKYGFQVWGGENSPYLWIRTKDGLSDWNYFDLFLEKMNLIIIPGSLFGDNLNKYFRLSAFGTKENMHEAVERIGYYYEK